MFESALLLILSFGTNTQSLSSLFSPSISVGLGESLNRPSLLAQNIVPKDQIPPVVEKGFAFEMLGCNVLQEFSRKLRCSFYVKNLQSSRRKLAIRTYDSYRGNTIFLDKDGQQVTASSATLGSSTSLRSAEAYLYPDTIVRLDIIFNGAPKQGTGLQLVELNLYAYGNGGGSFVVPFRIH
ncbi:hypothetical protein PseudUWO311_21395 [Pseudanabaena sp. UWO311]|uniref:hypothetical protein n=1 Tax=Pseudanabaena sp. UWO311 TaxID=2487337 RepID=UPI00115A667B|nr:hypothetical protein [Pseudanabaena sp. UWO311]TYQ23758.1 hypothetical protein PseudUWO311_21395 [Pseudanabaena sp. UWO311]